MATPQGCDAMVPCTLSRAKHGGNGSIPGRFRCTIPRVESARARKGKGVQAPARARLAWWLPLLVALVTVAAFQPVAHLGFTDWDDPFYATDQPLIRDFSPAGLGAIFSTFVEGNYHPLTMASLATDYHFWKLEPEGWHLVNLALHVLATLLVFAFVFLLPVSEIMAAVASVFFGIHPLHVEAVAWVSGRKDMLYTIFYLAGCISWFYWVKRRGLRAATYAIALLSFVLSLLAKGMAVRFSLALITIDYFLKRKTTLKTPRLEQGALYADAGPIC